MRPAYFLSLFGIGAIGLAAAIAACGGDNATTSNDDLAGADLLTSGTDMAKGADMAMGITKGSGTLAVSLTSASTSESASFAAGVAGSNPCTTSGSCTTCLYPDATSADGGTTTPPDTGAVTFKDGSTTIKTISPMSGLYMAGIQTGAPTIKPGDTIHFSSAGNSGAGEVPAIPDGTLTVPHAVTVTAPAMSTMATLTKASGVTVSWTGGMSGEKVVASLSANKKGSPATKIASITCTFDASAGTGMIPTSALTTQDNGALTISTTNSRTESVTGFDVIESVSQAPAGTWYYIISTIN